MIDLSQVADGRWRLTFEPTAEAGARAPHHRVEAGQLLRYRDRTRHIEQDWRDFPVTGISYNDALAYVTWLRRTGRVPGARLCDPHEWERAARGADDRIYPHGDQIDDDDANIDITYGQKWQAFGPDAAGSHPASDSPFGVADLCGNAWEWMNPAADNPSPLYGGGSFYQDVLSALSNSRVRSSPETRTAVLGMRVCADMSPPQ
jgi:formylglycine-generating enzyme required for sulfatase activity